METAITVLSTIVGILNIFLYFLLAYQIILSFWGYKRDAKDYQDYEPEMRFLILVPAHNEEAVISDIIHNLQEMDYPKELYDFYILADNCTDRTQSIAESLGAKVLVSKKMSSEEPTGKPIVLQKALQSLDHYQDHYDLIMIFDADNLMDRNMLREVNSQYLSNHKEADFIQCYLGCKNNAGPVALSDYLSYTITNRFFNYAKYRLHYNAGIGGTGFAVSTQYLSKRGGWTSMSLTEDFEIQMEATCEGRRILWNHNVRIYDEKPTNLLACFRQRTRWAQGRWFVTFKNTPAIFKALFHKKIKMGEFLSSITNMYNMIVFPILVLQLILNAIIFALRWFNGEKLSILPDFANFSASIISYIPYAVLFLYTLIVLFYVADHMDNHTHLPAKRLWELFLAVNINSYISGLSHLIGLFKFRQQKKWVKTEHKISAPSKHTVNSNS